MIVNFSFHQEHVLKDFPEFKYWFPKEPEKVDFRVPENIVGNQQRAFVIWCIIGEVMRSMKPGISVACGQVIEPFCFGIDKYFGDNHPQYGGKYIPQLTWDCNKLPFNDNTISFIVANHALEHMDNIKAAFEDWVRVLEPGGALIMVLPDASFEPQKGWDPNHKHFYTPERFHEDILKKCENKIKTEIFNDFSNFFSFNYLGRKK